MRTRVAWLTLFLHEAWAHSSRRSVETRGLSFSYPNTTTTTSSSTPGSSLSSSPITLASETVTPASVYTSAVILVTSKSDCVHTITTVTGVIPKQTVYVTVDGSYNVPVTASSASVTAPTIYDTPKPACSTAIVLTGNGGSMTLGQLSSHSIQGPQTGPHGSPLTLTISQPPIEVWGTMTTTVTVTKKTPIITVVPSTVSTLSLDRTDVGPGKPGSTSHTVSAFDQAPGSTADNGGGMPSDPDQSTSGPYLPPPISTTATVGGISITIGSSSVAIGTQTVALPTASQQTVVIGSQTLTVNPSQIIAPGTTYQIQRQSALTPTITQPPLIITTAGLTLTIGTTAAVIAGTTYRIGPGATGTTITVAGQTIAIGSSGVALFGATPTTFAPEPTIVGGREIVVVNGLTMAVDQTEAVISGTTFRIGPGAPATVVTIGGQTISIGPSGVVLPSTTIPPTSVPVITAASTPSFATSTRTSSSNHANQHNSAFTVQRCHPLALLTCIVIIIPGLFTLL